MTKIQISLEIMMSMSFAMLIAIVALQAYLHAYQSSRSSLAAISGYADSSSEYTYMLEGLCGCG
jgi:hypothetical protein